MYVCMYVCMHIYLEYVGNGPAASLGLKACELNNLG